MSVKDYDQRQVQIWHDAALSATGIYLPFFKGLDDPKAADEGLRKATTQRHRMYRLRKEMERERHASLDNAKKCKISTIITLRTGKVINFGHRKTWDDADVIKIELHIVAHSADGAMDAALEAAGYDVPEAPRLD